MLMLNSSHQFFQQIPVVTSANLLAMLGENSRSITSDPLAEIRNGEDGFERMFIRVLYFRSSSIESCTSLASFSC